MRIPQSHRIGRRALIVVVAVVLVGTRARSVQEPRGPAVSVVEIAPRFHLIAKPDANMILFTGEEVSLVAGVQRPELVATAIETVRRLRARPVRYALMMEDQDAPRFADAGWGKRGAMTLAHERLFMRMWQMVRAAQPPVRPETAQGQLPEVTFSHAVQLHIKDEETHFIRERPGYTDADVIVHFENSGIVYLGNAFTTDGYPGIRLDRGGDVTGPIETADWFLQHFAQAPEKVEPVVPGRGPVATMADLRAYRDMLVTVRDRVAALVSAGRSLEDVLQANPSAAFDPRWGHGPVSPREFVTLVYRSLAEKARSNQARRGVVPEQLATR